ncbi:MAG: stage II sporulation protein M [Burkholderiales bacterium]|nr:stage II sporulation protein M [Burkholderiales bacterium]
MKQQQFEQQYKDNWTEVAELCDGRGDGTRLPLVYRALCQSLALARQRGYSPSLTEHLHTLVLRAHRSIYGTVPERPLALRDMVVRTFPQRVREEWRLFLVAFIAFWGVAGVVGYLAWYDPNWAYSFASPDDLDEFTRMYQPDAARIGRGGSAGDVAMFGFYIWNNVSICFRTFAGGLFGGIPAIFSVVFNGVHGGVVAGWLTRNPATSITFWSFVVTHSSFEITGLLLSATAGMRLGLALIRPGRLSRRHSLLQASRRAFPIVVGAALLTVIAAFFEAFWSATPSLPPQVKFTVGAICWACVLGYFLFAGRRRAA